jgi:alpha-beta hydrolase superfamily lysophospholipase
MPRTPVVFIHGLWLHATSWASWAELFTEAGYDPIAPGWPGDPDTVEAARANPGSIADHGIDDVTRHYQAIIDTLPARPILIGHSFGGMISEKLLGLDYGAAAIGIDAAQIKGVLPLPLSALHSTLPVFKNPANKHKAVSLTAEQFRYSFGNAVSEEESNALYERWAIPALGGRVTATGRSGDAAFVRDLGAEAFIGAGDPVPAGFDVVIDTVGGAVLDASYRLLRAAGRLVTLGAPPSPERAKESSANAMFFVVMPDPGELAQLAKLVDEDRLRAVLSQTFPLPDGRLAFESGGRPRPPGKTVLTVR